MKLRMMATGEDFTAELVTEGIPAHIPGSLALKRQDTGEYIALKGVMGLDSKIGITDISPAEWKHLEDAGLMFAPHLPPSLSFEDAQRLADVGLFPPPVQPPKPKHPPERPKRRHK